MSGRAQSNYAYLNVMHSAYQIVLVILPCMFSLKGAFAAILLEIIRIQALHCCLSFGVYVSWGAWIVRLRSLFVMFYTFLVGCWTAEENTNVLGGQVNSADSVEACQSACIRNASCDGVDWNGGAQTGQKCWLSGPWSSGKRVGQAKGITHYNLNRTCKGKNLWLTRSLHVTGAKRTFQFNNTCVN